MLLRQGLATVRTVGSACIRSPHTAAALVVPTQHQQKRLMSSGGFAETYFKMRGYNQFGLYEDDILAPTATVEKAVTRLPDELQDLRNFRISRALQCQVGKTVLPKEEWTTYEDNLKNGNYLQPYIDEILKEEQERADWNKL